MQAGAFVGPDNDLAPGHALRFGDRSQHGLAGFQRFFSIFLEKLAGCGDRNLAAGAVQQFGADFFLERADLRGDRGLGAEALLRGAREAQQPRHFEKSFELVKVHKSSTWQLALSGRNLAMNLDCQMPGARCYRPFFVQWQQLKRSLFTPITLAYHRHKNNQFPCTALRLYTATSSAQPEDCSRRRYSLYSNDQISTPNRVIANGVRQAKSDDKKEQSMADPKTVLEFVKKNGVKMLDLRFTDFPGCGTTFPIPSSS